MEEKEKDLERWVCFDYPCEIKFILVFFVGFFVLILLHMVHLIYFYWLWVELWMCMLSGGFLPFDPLMGELLILVVFLSHSFIVILMSICNFITLLIYIVIFYFSPSNSFLLFFNLSSSFSFFPFLIYWKLICIDHAFR